MAIKGCVGCLRDVEDEINSLGIATICQSCKVPRERIKRDLSSEGVCDNCGGKTNFIGVFKKGELVFAYFDCPNPDCAHKRMTLVLVGRLLPRN